MRVILLIYKEILSKFKEKKDVLAFSYVYHNLSVTYRLVGCGDGCKADRYKQNSYLR